MGYIFAAIIGFIGGGICAFVALDTFRRRIQQQKREQDSRAESVRLSREEERRQLGDYANKLNEFQRALDVRQQQLAQQELGLSNAQAEFDASFVSYKELQDENSILKRDLLNLDVNLRKVELDRQLQSEKQAMLDTKINDLGSRYLKENVKWIGVSLNANNFANCKKRLVDVIERCRSVDFEVAESHEEELQANLKTEYANVVRAAFEREEQARIRAQIREEQSRQKEIDRELKRLDREREAIQAALEKALAEATDQHSAEIEDLRARLTEAEAKKQRAVSQAQLTKSGHVYVISNIGSFGEGVFKVGMSRRFDPMERVKELGGASVPFPFDVHMMISSDDAPTLEHAIHRQLHKVRVNKINPRKEYFRTDINSIVEIVKAHHGEVKYVADVEALDYRQSLDISDEDQEFIEHVFEEVEDELGIADDEGL